MKKKLGFSKSVFMFWVVLLQSFFVFAAHAAPDITVGNVANANPGDTVNIPVSFLNGAGASAAVTVQFDITFDNANLSLAAPSVDANLVPHTMSSSFPNATTLRVVIIPPLVLPLPAVNDGVLFSIPVTVVAGAAAGSYSLTIASVVLGDATANAIAVDGLTNGSVGVVINVVVPDVPGQTEAAATTTLTGLGLVVGNISTANHATVPVGDVISQTPASGASVATGTTFDLVISLGPVVLPDVTGQTEAAARATLTGLGLVVATTSSSHATVPVGNVISQNPPAGNVGPGSTVNLVISTGLAPPPSQNVPTLSIWGLLALLMVLPGIAAFMSRRRSRRT